MLGLQNVGKKLYLTDGRILFQPDIPFLVVVVGQACNFRCRDCGNFVPYMPKNFQRYDVESIIDNLKIILNAVPRIRNLQIQGGEPFIYSDLERLVEFVGGEEQVESLTIATNGSIIPSDHLLNVLKRNNAHIRISNYGVYPQKIKDLEAKCDQFGINHNIYDFASTKAMWYDQGGMEWRSDAPPPVLRRFFVRANSTVA